MKHRCLVAILFIFQVHLLVCQVLPAINPIGAGMAHATVAMQGSLSLFSNQAGLAGIENFIVLAAAEQRFLLSELKSASIGVAIPTKSGTFGLSGQSFGFEGFRQSKAAIAYGRKLGKNFSLGAQFDYLLTNISEYGSNGLFTFEAGFQARLNKQLAVGAHVTSPAQIEIVEGENLPTTLRIGVAWSVSDKLSIASEIEKNLDYKPRWKTGLSYQPIGSFYLRTGFSTEPSMLYFGLGYALKNGVKADFAGSFHQSLGFSPTAGLEWEKRSQ